MTNLNKNILAKPADGCFHEFVQKLVILLPPDAGLSQPDVCWILQECLIIGPYVEGDWKQLVGLDPG